MGRSDSGTVLSRLDYSPAGWQGSVGPATSAAGAEAEAEAEAEDGFYYDLAVRNAQVS